VVKTCIDEIAPAMTEACAKVVQHAGDHEGYQVDVAIDDRVCRISVLDNGRGSDPADAPTPLSPLDAGRGLMLMRALVDELMFRNFEDGRHGVVLEEKLVIQPRLRVLSTPQP
jgi:anti-sigma regulatory factor (Ser/Thr protein kinase)